MASNTLTPRPSGGGGFGGTSPTPSHGTTGTFGQGSRSGGGGPPSRGGFGGGRGGYGGPGGRSGGFGGGAAGNLGGRGGAPASNASAAGGGAAQAAASASAPGTAPTPAPPINLVPSAVNNQTYAIDGPNGRILCVADVRGNISSLNQLAAEHQAKAIIHTGDFGFYEASSLGRISDRTLKHLVQYSTLISPHLRTQLLAAEPTRGLANAAAATQSALRTQVINSPVPLLSDFPLFLNGQRKLEVPVFTVWGACEDVAILEKFRTGEYAVPNLHVLDEATTRVIDVGGVKLRLFGLGGAVVLHKLFDNGTGNATIAGGQGTMWTTVLQIGELVDTAQKVYDPTETRMLITHASPGREGLLAQLALALKADLTVSAGLHFRYGVSYNEFSVQHDAENFRNKLVSAKTAFGEVWDTVKSQVESVIDDNQRILLNNALAVTNRLPPVAAPNGAVSEEPAWKNTWNWNLPDAAYGSLVLDVRDGRISAETKSQGFNFAYRLNNVPPPASTPVANAIGAATARSALLQASPNVPNATPPPPPPQQQQQPPTGPKATRDFWDAAKSASSAGRTNGPSNNGGAAAGAAGNRANGGTPASAQDSLAPSASKRDLRANPKKERKFGSVDAVSSSTGARSDAESGAACSTDTSRASAKGKEGKQQADRPPVKRAPELYLSGLADVLPVSEEHIKSYFGDAAQGITHVKLAFSNERRHRGDINSAASGADEPAEGDAGKDKEKPRVQRPFALIEFVSEDAMQAGLKKAGQTLKSDKGGCVPRLEISTPPEERKKDRARGRQGAAFGKEQTEATEGASGASCAEKSGAEDGASSGRHKTKRGGQKRRGGAAAGGAPAGDRKPSMAPAPEKSAA
ncbi:hypothetical protein K437DRAFT_63692 [Tilletiaria anomala UBC 951]|uniref:DUF2433 domain-containing protein n=1 Tax=Tilletiaria anomala (strain ATCC 24038 / CBS 436.72 / UBC 951) TaxID=1037660 RepID=A0A066VBT3_TILAU|nr:uncharacterized protein K437DRAFT_63692 [Tilletiaria anomala UBC 951]KDN36050.1 hypothetical protein K437DRAFT_63692 [Tilletiaria anomala UBC 951]